MTINRRDSLQRLATAAVTLTGAGCGGGSGERPEQPTASATASIAAAEVDADAAFKAVFDALAAPILAEHPAFALRPGAAEIDVDRLAHLVGQLLPPALRRLYRLHDGERAYEVREVTPSLLCGYEFMSLRHVVEIYTMHLRIYADPRMRELDGAERFACVPPGAIHPGMFQPGWVPFASDGGGGHLAVDLNPGPDGQRGQIINFGRDDYVHFRLAPDLASFLALVRDKYRERRWHHQFMGEVWSLYDEMKDETGVREPGY